MQVYEWFRDGGEFMWYVLQADFVACFVIGAVLSGYKKSKPNLASMIVILISFVPLSVGMLGYLIDSSMAEAAVASLDPLEKEEFFEVFMELAKYPLRFGGISSIIIFITGIFALVYIRKRDEKKKESNF